MNPLNPFKMFNRLLPRDSKTKAINHIQKPGFYDMSVSNPYLYYRNHNDYENAFGSISVIANRSMVVQPYAVDERGKRVDNHPIINALYHPNQDMDAVEFREALAVFTLVHNKTYIRVHTRGGGSKPTIGIQGQTIKSNIIGFTFLEGVSELRDVSDVVYGYQVNLNGKVQQYTTDEVIVLKGVNPYNLDAGYSPSAAARKWMKLDDYIAEFEAGFFENGAVPKGQLVITAPSLPEYRDIKNALEQHHKGAGNNNNISYAYKPLDATGKPQNAQIEWVPFSQDNRSLDLGPLFEQVNKKIDSAYLVPASMRADNDNNTYASVRVDEAILVDNTIRPRLMKIWGKFTHELNRITGGIGVAITFDLETPGLADEDKIYAEMRSTDVGTLKTLTSEGYTFKSSVEYLKTNDISVLKIDKDFVKPTATAPTVDNPVVDNGEEVEDSPDEAAKALTPKVTKQISESDREYQENRIYKVVKDHLNRQVVTAINQLDTQMAAKAYGDATQTQEAVFADDLLKEIIGIVATYGAIEVELGRRLIIEAGLSTANVQPFRFTPEQRAAYRAYLNGVASYFTEQTAELIRETVSNGIANNLSRAEIEGGLRQIINGGFADYRASRIAVTEVNTAASKAGLFSMKNIQADTGYRVQKRKQHFGSDAPCEYCQALLDRDWVDIDTDYLPEGDSIEGVDGGVYKNTWRNIDCGDIHAYGHCGDVWRIVG